MQSSSSSLSRSSYIRRVIFRIYSSSITGGHYSGTRLVTLASSSIYSDHSLPEPRAKSWNRIVPR